MKGKITHRKARAHRVCDLASLAQEAERFGPNRPLRDRDRFSTERR